MTDDAPLRSRDPPGGSAATLNQLVHTLQAGRSSLLDRVAEKRRPCPMPAAGGRHRGGGGDEPGLVLGVRGRRVPPGRRGTGGGWTASRPPISKSRVKPESLA